MTETDTPSADQVLATLRDLMQASESDTARIQAAKILLERLAPKEEDEARRREAEERDEAMAEARTLLAELADLKSSGFYGAAALAAASAPEPADPAGQDRPA